MVVWCQALNSCTERDGTVTKRRVLQTLGRVSAKPDEYTIEYRLCGFEEGDPGLDNRLSRFNIGRYERVRHMHGGLIVKANVPGPYRASSK